MSGLEAIATALTVVEIIGRVVKVFGTPRNAPRQVQRLRRILEQLKDNADLLESATERDRLALADMINRSQDLLEKHAPKPSTGDRVRDFLWPARAEDELRNFNDEISAELALLYSKSRAKGTRGGQEPVPVDPAPLGDGSDRSPMTNSEAVPRGILRFEDNSMDDCTVVFLDAHDITIRDDRGYRINRVHAEYQFESVEARETFLLKVRERELLGRYFARAVLHTNGKIITQQKVIRIWKKGSDAAGSNLAPPQSLASRDRVTISFLGRGGQQFERPLGEFRRHPKQDGPGNNRITVENLTDSTGFVFEFDPPAQRRSSSFNRLMGFSSPPRVPRVGDADSFLATFMEHHPATSTFMPLPSPAVSIRSALFAAQAVECTTASEQGRSSSTADSDERFSGYSWTASSPGTSDSRPIVSGRDSARDTSTDLSTSPGTMSENMSPDFANELAIRFGLDERPSGSQVGSDDSRP
ncbi:uncharacterized protein B0I36DRAFT_349817 [Microdochium trichocladiopsis]|uniref:Uncharacterized protein n=1 Tax=Microdochium trichocladiopsis TaxID=1682393 RepID=A0A9P9BP94_9PEZI|nr:uncharacterized protein B0I36DRAFT_349817 [Microdochium trichocladiopsis]KAH7028825.1 hypothetical protein B0I36DRAFT_349817 [Microdochium trichocladiopsis]